MLLNSEKGPIEAEEVPDNGTMTGNDKQGSDRRPHCTHDHNIARKVEESTETEFVNIDS